MLEEIDKIIRWYQKNYAGASLHHLMDAKSKLLTLCYRYSEEVSTAKKDSVIATAFRKAEHHNIKSRLIDEGMTQGLAESKSIDQTKTMIVDEANTEAIAFKSKLVLDIALKISEDISQRISVLKKEMESVRDT